MAVALNQIQNEGEEEKSLAKLRLFNISQGKFVKFFEAIELKGAITGMLSIFGNLILCQGNKIGIYCFDQGNIVKVTEQYLKNVCVDAKIKNNVILVADLFNGFQVFHFRDGTFRVAADEMKQLQCTAAEFCVELKDKVNVIKGYFVADRAGFIRIYEQLTEQEAKHGCTINIVQNAAVKMHSTVTALSGMGMLTCYATQGGEIGLISHLKDSQFQVLEALVNSICKLLPFRAGIEPRIGRMVGDLHQKYKSGVILRELVDAFVNLPLKVQEAIGKQIAYPREFIIQTIIDVITER